MDKDKFTESLQLLSTKQQELWLILALHAKFSKEKNGVFEISTRELREKLSYRSIVEIKSLLEEIMEVRLVMKRYDGSKAYISLIEGWRYQKGKFLYKLDSLLFDSIGHN